MVASVTMKPLILVATTSTPLTRPTSGADDEPGRQRHPGGQPASTIRPADDHGGQKPVSTPTDRFICPTASTTIWARPMTIGTARYRKKAVRVPA